jgi:hypothetical protein
MILSDKTRPPEPICSSMGSASCTLAGYCYAANRLQRSTTAFVSDGPSLFAATDFHANWGCQLETAKWGFALRGLGRSRFTRSRLTRLAAFGKSNQLACYALVRQIWAMPPSTKSSIPLTKLLSSEARNRTAFAISSGTPTRPSGIKAAWEAMKPVI